MLYPRWVRRRLLLPPGWVALGFLLLSGCLTIVPHWRQVRLSNVVQLTMPPLHTDKLWPKILYQSPQQLAQFRPWYDAQFEGKKLADFLNASATESAIKKIMADTSHTGGVRVRFLPGSTYTDLVRVLDIMLYTDQKKYWLDTRHQPITLYAITMQQKRMRNVEAPVYLGCCTCGPHLPKPEAKKAWFLKFQGLWTKPWQPTAILLALTSILSLRPLLRRRLFFTLHH